MKKLKNKTLYCRELIQNPALTSSFRLKDGDFIYKGEINQTITIPNVELRLKNNGNAFIENIIEE
jgi:hypothetical protein